MAADRAKSRTGTQKAASARAAEEIWRTATSRLSEVSELSELSNVSRMSESPFVRKDWGPLERDRFEERAAILEFDAGLERGEAEYHARRFIDGSSRCLASRSACSGCGASEPVVETAGRGIGPDVKAPAIASGKGASPATTAPGSTSQPGSGAALPALASRRHQRVATTLCHALTLADAHGWLLFAAIATVRLRPRERYDLADAVLLSLPPDDMVSLAAEVLVGAGSPLPCVLAADCEAKFWAGLASPQELRAYATAAIEAMSPSDRRKFLSSLG